MYMLHCSNADLSADKHCKQRRACCIYLDCTEFLRVHFSPDREEKRNHEDSTQHMVCKDKELKNLGINTNTTSIFEFGWRTSRLDLLCVYCFSCYPNGIGLYIYIYINKCLRSGRTYSQSDAECVLHMYVCVCVFVFSQ